jgi:crotonobetaine/carnitine-CoA ligase
MTARRRHRTIPELFDAAASEHSGSPWLLAGDEMLTYGGARQASFAVGAAAAERGLGHGDLVVLVAENTPRHVVTWLGLMERGVLLLAVNPRSTVDELAGLVGQTEPALVLHEPHAAAVVVAAVAAAGVRTPLADVADLQGDGGDDRTRVGLAPGDPAVLIPTSGTTGRSKLVTQTHRAYVMAGEGFPWWLGLDEHDRFITPLPLFHVNTQAYSVLGSMAAGASLVQLDRFSASTFIDSACRHGATHFNSIGSLLELLMLQPPREDDADNPLRTCYTAPSPSPERHLEIEGRFGIRVVCGYGMSESPYGLIWPRGERPLGTMGAPRQHPTMGHVNDVRVMVDGHEAADGDVGELELRNPAVMTGYFGMPEESAEVLVDGWLRTGDLVVRDGAGWYRFVARKKEVIRRRGENLAPVEVEDAIVAHPGVAAAAVIAVPSELGEDDVKAFVMPVPGTSIDLAVLRSALGERLSRFKVPRYLECVDELPLTPTGRVAKHKLPRDRTAGEIDFDDAARPRSGGPT